ncbi:phosphoribosyl-ATP pyrophosphohydrolase [Ignicoccus pacificus DSM 13166]|uniref:Phosphoribosyl-ATP pyrophosphohydrolase n=1 Tax=Ignicoccus pacificus DSM 13166 TaxID=940294 RepID=A0A977KA82_9CREN|nr:phosphoribosyl-ATP pyrophosphohydrolase [Ignicoccus pacificus DSM 13166]
MSLHSQPLREKGVEEKLVRDFIPIIAEGCYRKATPSEALDYLAKKLVEEALEFLVTKDPMELADVESVLKALTKLMKVNLEELTLKKDKDRGGFKALWIRTECYP